MSEKNLEILKTLLPVKKSITSNVIENKLPSNPEFKSITTNLNPINPIKLAHKCKEDIKRRNTYQHSNTNILNLLKIMSENVYTHLSIKRPEVSDNWSDEEEEVILKNRNYKFKTRTIKKTGSEVKCKVLTFLQKEEENHLEEADNNIFDFEGNTSNSRKNSTAEADIIGDLINRYFYDIAENLPGRFEDYVVNNLAIISYLQKIIPEDSLKAQLSIENQEIVSRFDRSKKVLFLDLDETLIHSDFENEYQFYDAEILIPVDDQTKCKLNILIRPYVQEFLQFAQSKFNVVLFTAGVKDYADSIINFLDPSKEIFKLRLYRDSCFEFKNFFIKDLRILEGFESKNLILVDNCIFSLASNLSNGIVISSYYRDSEDKELLNLMDYLDKLSVSDDVRDANESYYGLDALKDIMYENLIKEGIVK